MCCLVFSRFLSPLFFNLNPHIHWDRRLVAAYLTFPRYCGEVERSAFFLSVGPCTTETSKRTRQVVRPRSSTASRLQRRLPFATQASRCFQNHQFCTLIAAQGTGVQYCINVSEQMERTICWSWTMLNMLLGSKCPAGGQRWFVLLLACLVKAIHTVVFMLILLTGIGQLYKEPLLHVGAIYFVFVFYIMVELHTLLELLPGEPRLRGQPCCLFCCVEILLSSFLMGP